MPKCYF